MLRVPGFSAAPLPAARAAPFPFFPDACTVEGRAFLRPVDRFALAAFGARSLVMRSFVDFSCSPPISWLRS